MLADKSSAPLARSAFNTGSDFKPKNDKEKTLSEIFMPPTHLMSNDNFETVSFVIHHATIHS